MSNDTKSFVESVVGIVLVVLFCLFCCGVFTGCGNADGVRAPSNMLYSYKGMVYYSAECRVGERVYPCVGAIPKVLVGRIPMTGYVGHGTAR